MSRANSSRLPLAGVRVIEVGGIGPNPFAGMMLADMGADVVRVDRPKALRLGPAAHLDVLNRGKRSVALDLKHPAAIEAVMALAGTADVLTEGFRPGVAERLGLGPTDIHKANPRLVYGRMTGWGQEGPLATTAGHDIDYIASTGALHAIGRSGEAPQVPLNLVGDFGGGSGYLVAGVLAGLVEVARTGRGRVVDAAIVDGVSHMLASVYGFLNASMWIDERGVNSFDGGSPYYSVYETSDQRHMAVGAVEPQFYARLIERLGLTTVALEDQAVRATWPRTTQLIAEVFASQTQAHWAEVFDAVDACVTPVVSIGEARSGSHLRERGTILLRDGRPEPAPAPRFDGVPPRLPSPPPEVGQDTSEVLGALGLDVERLLDGGAAYQTA